MVTNPYKSPDTACECNTEFSMGIFAVRSMRVLLRFAFVIAVTIAALYLWLQYIGGGIPN
jgi:hypothetical protein